METRSLHVLVCDDEPQVRDSLAKILRRRGYAVTVAADGQEALELLAELQAGPDPVDLVLTDIQMPRLTGAELVDELRRTDLLVPVIAITGYGDKEMVVDLLRRGFAGYLDKPFELEQIEQCIAQVLERDAAERQRERGRVLREEKKSLSASLDSLVLDLNQLVQEIDSRNTEPAGFAFAPVLRGLRERAGLSKLQMARAAGILPAHYCALEADPPTLPSLKDLHCIARRFGVSAALLVAMAECPDAGAGAGPIPDDLRPAHESLEALRAALRALQPPAG